MITICILSILAPIVYLLGFIGFYALISFCTRRILFFKRFRDMEKLFSLMWVVLPILIIVEYINVIIEYIMYFIDRQWKV